jgi:protocatechuate 3,4-dioxygenase beta subunit
MAPARDWQMMNEGRITRRGFALRVAGGIVGAALGRCGGSSTAAPALASDADGANACKLYLQQTEGPYYLDLEMLRRDITEGRAGLPLGLELRVLNAATCAPLAGIVVDVWHCDATGLYSGYPRQLGNADTRGETFLRGSQVTDGDGRVRFDTIYPGWYPGRTTHVHFKVHVTGTKEATSQLYFPEDVTSAVYATAPYSSRGGKDTTNATDGVARRGLPPLVTVTAEGSRRLAATTIAVAL